MKNNTAHFKKNMILSVIAILVALSACITAVLGWFANNQKMDGIEIGTVDFAMESYLTYIHCSRLDGVPDVDIMPDAGGNPQVILTNFGRFGSGNQIVINGHDFNFHINPGDILLFRIFIRNIGTSAGSFRTGVGVQSTYEKYFSAYCGYFSMPNMRGDAVNPVYNWVNRNEVGAEQILTDLSSNSLFGFFSNDTVPVNIRYGEVAYCDLAIQFKYENLSPAEVEQISLKNFSFIIYSRLELLGE